MKDKVCVVTGATDGIGRVTARELARRGADVTIVGRDAAKGGRVVDAMVRETANAGITFEHADLSSQAEIRALAGRLNARLARIDVLVNNVGAYFHRRVESVDGIEMTFALNHLGYYLLTGLLLARVRAADAGRIVNVASSAHQGPQVDLDDPGGRRRYRGLRAYQQSKLANILFTRRLAAALEGSGVTANALHPGFVASKFGHNTRGWFNIAIRLAQQISAINVEKGARTSVYVAASPDVAGVNGRYFDECRAIESSPESRDAVVGERLWALSGELTGCRYG